MESKTRRTEVPSPTPLAATGIEVEIYRALLDGGDAVGVAGRVLGPLRARLSFDWAALIPRAAEGADLPLAAWTSGPGGGVRPEDPPLTLRDAPAHLDLDGPRDELLPLAWGGALSDLLAERGLLRALGVPLGEAGALVFARRSEEPFERAGVSLVDRIASSLARVIEAADRERDLERRIEERTRELAVLYEVSRAAGTTLHYDDLIRLLVNSTHSLLGFDIAALLLDLPGMRSLTLHPSRPASVDCRSAAAGVVRAAYEELSGRPAPDCEIVERPIDEFDPGAAQLQGRLASHRSAPLIRRGQIVGALSVLSRRDGAFPEGRARLLPTLANHASLTLDRLRTLQEAEEGRVQSIIDSMPSGVLMTDLEFRVAFANPAAVRTLEALTGGPIPAVLGMLGGASFPEIASPVLLENRTSVTTEITTTDPRRIYTLSVSPVAGAGGRIEGVVLVISEVTEGRLMQEQLLQSEKLSALGEMISGVAHELNNPLASVMGYAQLLQGARVREEVRSKLQTIYAEAQRCQRIVQNLLSFARKHKPERRQLDLNAVLTSVLALLSYQLRVDSVRADVHLGGDLPAIPGDFHLLQQVFLNIMNNAHQAMHEAGAGGVLTVVSGLTEEARVRVEIRDTGPGISPENLKRIFDPFFTTKQVGQGTGLGLSLAYGTVKDHGGSIYARSQLGKGTTFIVELPVGDPVAESPARAEAAPIESGKRARILLVEDEAALGKLLVEALTREGHRVDLAADGLEALERIGAQEFDLVLSDVKMPRMDGRRFFEEVAQTRPGLESRIVFTTGDVASHTTRAFLSQKGVPFIEKPFDLAEVLRVVAHHIARLGA